MYRVELSEIFDVFLAFFNDFDILNARHLKYQNRYKKARKTSDIYD